jgi:transcriptional regulator
MPKKKYNDKVLRVRALELRSRGLSYREIALSLATVSSRFTS